MNLWEKFKNLFNRNKTQALPAANPVQTSIGNETTKIVLNRNDGSTITIVPVLDRIGNQTYEQIYNTRTGQNQCIPKYSVSCNELSEIYNQSIISKTIYMDIDPKLLTNPYYSEYIANNILNKNRMSKIISEYGNYAGGLNFDENGNIAGKYVDAGIINTLRSNRTQKYMMENAQRAQNEQERITAIRENAENRGVHIKTSHAEVLSTPSGIER